MPQNWVDINPPQTPETNWVDINPPEAPQEPYKGGAARGFLTDIPKDLYESVTGSAKSAQKKISAGDYPGAFFDIFGPLVGGMKTVSSYVAGEPLPKPPPNANPYIQTAMPVLGAAGMPVKRFQEAWEHGDYPRIAGQVAAAALLYHGAKKLGSQDVSIERAGTGGGGESVPPGRGGGTPSDWLPFEDLPQDRPPVARPPEPTRNIDLLRDINEPQQQGLPLGPYRNPKGRFANTGPSRPATVRPFVDTPMQQTLDLGPDGEPWSSRPLEVQTPPAPTTSPVETPVVETPPTTETPRPSVPGAIPEGAMRHEEGADFGPIPLKELTKELVVNLQKDGYYMEDPVNGTVTFKKATAEQMFGELKPPRLSSTEGGGGGLPPEDILRQMLGREPTAEELAAATHRQAQPGESTGNVAPFETRSNNEIEIRRTTDPTELNNLHNHWTAIFRTTQDPHAAAMVRLVEQQMAATRPGWQWEHQHNIDPTTRDLYGSRPEDAQQSPYGPEYAGQEEFPDDLRPNAETISFPNHDISGIRQQEVLGQNESRGFATAREMTLGPTASGPRGIADIRIDRPVPQQMGQQELPLGPVARPTTDEYGIPQNRDWNQDDIWRINQEMQQEQASRVPQPEPPAEPQQLSMEDQMQAPPPEPRLSKRSELDAILQEYVKAKQTYEAMIPISVDGVNRKALIHDSGNRLTNNEIDLLSNHPVVHDLIGFYNKMINEVFRAIGRPDLSARVEGVALLLDDRMHGVLLPNPGSDKGTLGFNPFPRIKDNTPGEAAWDGMITVEHESAHTDEGGGGSSTPQPVNFSEADLKDPRLRKLIDSFTEEVAQHDPDTGHGVEFLNRLGEIYAKFGVDNAYRSAAELYQILTRGRSGEYSSEVQELLQLYTKARGRPATSENIIGGEGIKQANKKSGGTEPISGDNRDAGDGTTPRGFGGRVGEEIRNAFQRGPNDEPSTFEEMVATPTNLTTTGDLSAPLRQGLPQIFTKEWRQAVVPMLRAFGNPEYSRQVNAELMNLPAFQRFRDTKTGKIIPSLADKAGMKPIIGSDVTRSEMDIASSWAETGKPLDLISTKLGDAYRTTAGRYFKASNRAYATFLNHIRMNSFQNLVDQARATSLEALETGSARPGLLRQNFTPEAAAELNPYANMQRAKEIADYVNTVTGRGPLKTHIIPVEGTEINVEAAANILRWGMFAPRLVASRMRMLNPNTYVMATPFVRKQYLKSAFGLAAAWSGVAMLGKAANQAGIANVQVSFDPNSADFMKLRFGNTRLDPGGGFQQFLVAYSRMITGHETSSNTQKDFELGVGYRPFTRGSALQQFGSNKLNPFAKFGYDLLFATERQPVHMLDRTAQMFVPLVHQDLLELLKSDPYLLPLMIPVAGGMGLQTYDKGESIHKIVPDEYDWLFKGGGADIFDSTSP